ncbi:Phytochrome-like protein cph1 [Boseongicola aestuarii]|uniref:histidine kinase n=1 Tax=Boseongicola aestuarii TaxID=1470561 RepID=A0A238IWK9_9RHOB|nr:Phytochrome-like protein cph1 [Boseongicola aestuarii]
MRGVLQTLDLELKQSGAVVEISVSIALPQVICQPPQIAQALQNLISNAIKYAGDSPPQIMITVTEDACEMVEFDVTDQGIGIPAAFIARIFEPFKRAPGSGDTQGTGLGPGHMQKGRSTSRR